MISLLFHGGFNVDPIRLSELSTFLGGTLVGDGEALIDNITGIKEAEQGDITFLANKRYIPYLKTTKASAVIIPSTITPLRGKNFIQVENPYIAFMKVVKFFSPEQRKYPPGIHSTAVIGKGVSLGKDVTVQPFAIIEDNVKVEDNSIIMAGVFIGHSSHIGSDCLIYPNVTIRENVYIGNRVIIHSGSVVGSDGFGFAKNGETHEKVPQLGKVIVEDDVELGANVTVDRATLGVTHIKKGTKIDNLVQIGHNVIVGENSIIVAQVGISGSSVIGKDVVLAGQAGVVGHIEIGDHTIVGAQAGVTKPIPSNTCVSGYPARPHQQAKKTQAYISRIPSLAKTLKQLKSRVTELEKQLAQAQKEHKEKIPLHV
jgi:UDP-3-O-[3-hydroxymyristoyl] glucosamine N-acyltransferase